MKVSRNRTTKPMKAIVTLAMMIFVLVLSNSSHAGSTTIKTLDDDQSLFKSKCATCHGADGSGNTTMGKQLNVRDLRSTEIQKQTNVQLAGIIKNGKGKMPAFGKSLNDGQINQLVAFIRTLRK